MATVRVAPKQQHLGCIYFPAEIFIGVRKQYDAEDEENGCCADGD